MVNKSQLGPGAGCGLIIQGETDGARCTHTQGDLEEQSVSWGATVSLRGVPHTGTDQRNALFSSPHHHPKRYHGMNPACPWKTFHYFINRVFSLSSNFHGPH